MTYPLFMSHLLYGSLLTVNVSWRVFRILMCLKIMLISKKVYEKYHYWNFTRKLSFYRFWYHTLYIIMRLKRKSLERMKNSTVPDLTWIIHVRVIPINCIRTELRVLVESNCATRHWWFQSADLKAIRSGAVPRVIALPRIYYVTEEINSAIVR